jgi:hypothetical protein
MATYVLIVSHAIEVVYAVPQFLPDTNQLIHYPFGWEAMQHPAKGKVGKIIYI